MLTDCTKNWNNYGLGSVWDDLMLWITQNATPIIPEGKYSLPYCTIDIFSTALRLEGSCLYESHKTMCDLHMVLQGEEYFWSRPINYLEIEGTFNSEKDIGFYKIAPHDTGVSRLKLTGDTWALVFPWDAHLPDIAISDHTVVIKKLVAKIPLSCLTISTKKISHG